MNREEKVMIKSRYAKIQKKRRNMLAGVKEITVDIPGFMLTWNKLRRAKVFILHLLLLQLRGLQERH